jgi:hypothetical protein
VADSQHQHEEEAVSDLVNHPVVAYLDAIAIRGASRSWIALGKRRSSRAARDENSMAYGTAGA